MTNKITEVAVENNPYTNHDNKNADMDTANIFMDLAEVVLSETSENQKSTEAVEGDEESTEAVEEDEESTEAVEEDEESTEEDVSDNTEFVIKLNDKEEFVTLKDLKSNYINHEQSSNELAEKAKELDNYFSESKEALKKYAFGKNKIINQYKSLTDEDWDAMSADDYMIHNKQFIRAKTEMEGLNKDYDALNDSIAMRDKAIIMESALNAIETLSKDVKGWSDEMYQSLLNFAISEGIDSDMINKSTDPNLLRVLNEARMGRNAQAEISDKITIKKKTKNIRGIKLDHNQKAKTQSANPYDADTSSFLAFT
jgi:hypothetical protein